MWYAFFPVTVRVPSLHCLLACLFVLRKPSESFSLLMQRMAAPRQRRGSDVVEGKKKQSKRRIDASSIHRSILQKLHLKTQGKPGPSGLCFKCGAVKGELPLVEAVQTRRRTSSADAFMRQSPANGSPAGSGYVDILRHLYGAQHIGSSVCCELPPFLSVSPFEFLWPSLSA